MSNSIIMKKEQILSRAYTDYGKYYGLLRKFLQQDEYVVKVTDFKSIITDLLITSITNPNEKDTSSYNLFLIFTKSYLLSDEEVLVLMDLLHDKLYCLALDVIQHNPKLYKDELVTDIKFPCKAILNTDISLLAPASFSSIARFKQGLMSLIKDNYPSLYVEVCDAFNSNLGSVDYMINALLATLYKYDTYILDTEDCVEAEGVTNLNAF